MPNSVNPYYASISVKTGFKRIGNLIAASCLLYLFGLFSFMVAFHDPDSCHASETVTDSMGRTITLERSPDRIACLYAFSSHVVTMLGRGGDMVAVVGGIKKDVLLHQILPGVKQIPVPSKGGVIHIESLLKLRPDLLFLKPETAAAPSEIQKLERFHLSYFVAGYHSMKTQMTIIENMGRAIGCSEKADAYTRYYRNTIKRIRTRVSTIPEDQRMRLYHSVNEPNRTDGPGTLEADWTKVCGVINVSVGKDLDSRKNKFFAGMEQILVWNPQVIIANEWAVADGIRSDKKWASIQAVRDQKVFPIPVGISRWGHPGGLETPLAILWTAKTVYPDLFKDIDLKQEIGFFYDRFFSLQLNEKTLDKILSGKGMRGWSRR